MAELKRTLVHLTVHQLERLDKMRDENTSRAGHIRKAIDAYLDLARRRSKLA